MHTKRLFVFVLAIAVFLAAPLSFAVTRVTMANGQESCVDSSHMQADIRFLARWGDGSKPNLAGGWRDFTTVSTKFFGIAEVSGTYPGEFFLQLMKGGRVVSRAKVTPAQGGLGAIFDAEYVDGVSLADTSGQIFARFARGKKGGPQLCIRYYRPDDKSEIEAINKTKRVILVKVESGDFAKEVRLGPGVLYDFAAEFSGRVSSSDPKSGQKMISGSWDWHRLPWPLPTVTRTPTSAPKSATLSKTPTRLPTWTRVPTKTPSKTRIPPTNTRTATATPSEIRKSPTPTSTATIWPARCFENWSNPAIFKARVRWAEWDVYNGKWLISAEIMNNSPRTLLLRAFHEGSVVFESEFYPGDHRSAILNADPGSVNEVTSIRIEDQLGRKVVEFRKEQNMLYPGPELCLQFLPDQSTHIQATNLTVYWLDANFKTENGGGTSLLAPWSQADFYIGGKVGEAWLEVLGQTPFYRAEWDWSKLEPGVFGYAADLNGGAFLQINASEPLNISLASTVELWFKPAKPAFNAYLVSKMSGTVHRRILSIRV